MSLAAESARLSLWEWDSARGEIWMTEQGRALPGSAPASLIDCAALTGRVHPDDRAARKPRMRRAVETGAITRWNTARCNRTVRWAGLPPAGAACGMATRRPGSWASRWTSLSRSRPTQRFANSARNWAISPGWFCRRNASSLAHELNQPLAAIVTNASAAQRFLARGELKPEDLRELLADIASDGHRASEVIRGIKGMALGSAGETRAVDLDEVVASVLRLVRADARAQGCTLETELDPGLPAVTGDPVQLQQVLLNLIVNALDAMRQNSGVPRRITVSTRLVFPETVEVAVRDTGPGLPGDVGGRVFERFYSTKPEGMGMGLAIARSIIEAHFGKLDGGNVPSEAAPAPGSPPIPARGARFWFQLPVRKTAKMEATA